MTETVTDHFYTSADGLRLHARIHGEPRADRLPVVCLPGLTRNVRDFEALAQHLADGSGTGRQVVAFDYRGRGLSAPAADWKSYNVLAEAQDIVAGLASLGIEKAHFIGTSRGGLILHVLAATKPELIASAVLNDIGPVVEREGLALIRSYLDRPDRPATMAEAAAVQRGIHGEAFPILRDADWLRFAHAIYREKGGRPAPDFDPALLNVLTTFDPAKPMQTLWPQFDMLAKRPVLVIRGENSRLLSPATFAGMGARGSLVDLVTAAGQGHAPFLEIEPLPGLIADFLDRADRADASA